MRDEQAPLSPYQFSIVVTLMRARLTAEELTHCYPCYGLVTGSDNPVLAVSNMLRPLVKRGWIEKTDPASLIYQATERARKAVCW